MATIPIAAAVATGLRCEVGWHLRLGVKLGRSQLAAGRREGTSAGATATRDGNGSLLVHTDSLTPPAGYDLCIARLDTYCHSHPRQRMHPEALGMPGIPCGVKLVASDSLKGATAGGVVGAALACFSGLAGG